MKMTMIKALILALALSVAPLGHALQQEQSNWCWAGAIQNVMAQDNVYRSQRNIATDLLGAPWNQPASVGQIGGLLRSYGFRAWQTGRPGSPQELHQTLMGGWKIIAFVRPTNGAVGHFIVLQGMDQTGRVVVSDPWTGQTRHQSLHDLYNGWRWFDTVVVGTRL